MRDCPKGDRKMEPRKVTEERAREHEGVSPSIE